MIVTDTGVVPVQLAVHAQAARPLRPVALDARTVAGQFAAHQSDDRRATQLRTGRLRTAVTVARVVVVDTTQRLIALQTSTVPHTHTPWREKRATILNAYWFMAK